MRSVGGLFSLRVFICSLFLLVFGLAAPAFAGAVEIEERAEAATEFLDESVSEVRGVIRETRPQLRRDSCYIRAVRVASNRVPVQGRGRIRICETAPLPLRC
jgi:signal transduction histidine kinase